MKGRNCRAEEKVLCGQELVGRKLDVVLLTAWHRWHSRYQAAVARRKKSAAVKKVFNKLKSTSE